jgi:hypothetical protein
VLCDSGLFSELDGTANSPWLQASRCESPHLRWPRMMS